MKVYTYWECPHCDSIVRGKKRDCPNCGAPIPNDTRYLMPDNPKVIQALRNGSVIIEGETHTDEKGIKSEIVPESDWRHEKSSPNWLCDSCGCQNFAKDDTCVGCGTPRGTKTYFNPKGKPLRTDEPDDIYEDEPFEEDVLDDETDEDGSYTYVEPKHEEIRPKQTERKSFDYDRFWRNYGMNIFKGILVAIGAMALIFLLVWLFTPVTRTATVQGFRWERVIQTEEYKLCHESDWSVPANGRVTRESREIHHYDNVIDHYETKTKQVSERVCVGYDTSYRDNGDGTADVVRTPIYETQYHTETYQEPVYKKVPVYRTKYYYDIDKWVSASPLRTTGAGQEPYWPETDIPTSVFNPNYGDLRQSGRQEYYYVRLKDEDENIYEIALDFNRWSSLTVGNHLTYKSYRFTRQPALTGDDMTIE